MSAGILALPSLLRATAWDAGCASMRRAGRERWSQDDYNASVAEMEKRVAAAYGDGVYGWVRFQAAEELERARRLSLRMKPRDLNALIDTALREATHG